MVQAKERVVVVDDHADGVEADRARGRPAAALVAQPRGGEAAQTGSLTVAQPAERLLIGTDVPASPSDAARLHLRKHEHASIEGDQVDLAVVCAHVAFEQREAEPTQVRCGEILANPPESAPSVDTRAESLGGAFSSRGPLGVHARQARAIGVT